MSGTELFDGDEREFEGTQFECNVYQTSSGSDLESGEEPNIPSTEEIIKSAFSSKRKASGQGVPKGYGEKRPCEQTVAMSSPTCARFESSHHGEKGMSLRAPLSAKQMYTTQSRRFQEKHLLGKKQISASAPKQGGRAYCSREPIIPRRVFREGRENNEITPRPLMDSSPRQQIRPPPVQVRESHSHEPLTPREDRGRCPRQSITPTTTKQNHSQVVTPIARPLREHSEPPVSSGALGVEVKTALAEITSLLNNVVQRVERMETELQQQHSTSVSSSSDTSLKYVPRVVRSEVRKMYNDLLEDDPEFDGFKFESSLGFKDPTNKAVTKTLITQVHALNPEFQAAQIRAATYTYYTSLLLENRLKTNGRHEDRKRARRRRERLLRKLLERQSALKKLTLPEKDKDKWGKVIVADVMSSEESAPENEEMLLVKPLEWRSERVSQFFQQLDDKMEQSKKAQARRQRKQRVISNEFSVRPRPIIALPTWAIAE